jgi:inositol-hexakisphosphate kinase
MILENLTGKYRHPCVLDLKIGTRTYSDIMSPEKVQLHVDRSAISTTSKLGIRFCGMQLYNPVEKCYNLYDKYFGSSLDEITLKEAIKNFVFDSQKYRTDVIEGLIKKLKKLRDIIGQLETYRFFSSSLLVMYEGHQEETFDITATPGDRSNVADIRMIDFANYTHSGFVHDPVSYQGPDKDYMWGLSNLINILESINDN